MCVVITRAGKTVWTTNSIDTIFLCSYEFAIEINVLRSDNFDFIYVFIHCFVWVFLASFSGCRAIIYKCGRMLIIALEEGKRNSHHRLHERCIQHLYSSIFWSNHPETDRYHSCVSVCKCSLQCVNVAHRKARFAKQIYQNWSTVICHSRYRFTPQSSDRMISNK